MHYFSKKNSTNEINVYFNNQDEGDELEEAIKIKENKLNLFKDDLNASISLNINSDNYRSSDGIYLTSLSTPYQKDNNLTNSKRHLIQLSFALQ